jgi:6-phosphogluconolactonase
MFLDSVPVPATNIHRIPVNLEPHPAAIAYEEEIKKFFDQAPQQFDLVLLGLGEDGHTASLFPGTPVLNEKKAGVRPVYVEQQHMYRVTLTAPLFNQAANVAFLVSGPTKRAILKKVIEGQYNPTLLPAQLIKPVSDKLFWFTDADAAALVL